MSDFPQSGVLPLFVHSYSLEHGPMQDIRASVGGANAQAMAWVANLAIYIPISLPFAYPVRRLFWVNGGTLTSSHADFGIYTAGGVRIVSAGSTALSGASAPQYITPSPDLVLGPGRYYFAYACDNTTSRAFGTIGVAVPPLRECGVLQQAAAFPLPSTMTPAAVTNALFPLCGITRTASGF